MKKAMKPKGTPVKPNPIPQASSGENYSTRRQKELLNLVEELDSMEEPVTSSEADILDEVLRTQVVTPQQSIRLQRMKKKYLH